MNNQAIRLDWKSIDTVLLDMDGTLLDKHFDDYFWEQYVPQAYAEKTGISLEAARTELLSLYKSREGTLAWTDLDFWSEELGLDIPALKIKVDYLIRIHPYVIDFLKFCREIGKKICLVTNAHGKTLASSVRGYRENQFVRDNGISSSGELRIPLGHVRLPWISNRTADGMLQLAPFIDYGRAWNVDDPGAKLESIASFGAGLLWDPSPQLHARIYVSRALDEVTTGPEYDLQDSGIHFLVRYTIF